MLLFLVFMLRTIAIICQSNYNKINDYNQFSEKRIFDWRINDD